MKHTILLVLLLVFITSSFSQKGKKGIITISTPTTVNEFASVINDVNINDNQLTLSQTTLNDNNRFGTNLSPGDLILIIQLQGASVDASAEPWTGNGTYGLPYSAAWGAITNYNNCGNYEYAEVANINSSSVITLRCGVLHNYTAAGKVQIVRIPRYETLTINDSLTTQQWDGITGGVCAIEVNGNLTINTAGVISANGKGFRGGVAALRSNILGAGEFATINPTHGGMKGEGIAGYANVYTPMGGQYGKGAAANAGGGSTSHNAGGGGGANAGDILNWIDGVGIPNTTYNTAWGLETPSISGVISSGGGRGGYTYSDDNQNANTTGPGNAAWDGDARKNNGGLGGRPLDYSLNRLFFGGGGGAGELNDSENLGGSGGNAGGLILLKVLGNITGTGKILADGENGEDIYTNNAPIFSYAGNDGAGGAGAGGTIKIDNTTGATIANITISATGGNGGSQLLQRGSLYINFLDEAEGPGGGGGGGFVSIPTNTATLSVIGGINGTTNSDALTEFPPNGATSGGSGLINSNSSIINILALNDTICYGNSTTLNASLNSTLPTGATVIWYDQDYNMISTGLSYTTGTITSDTSFHVGICPGNSSVLVKVILGSSFTIDTSNLQITNEHCNLSDGAITGITILGGALPLSYQWNGISSPSLDLSNLSSGTHQLIVTDANGCSAVAGTFNLTNESGPVLDISNANLINESCSSMNGSISGITVSGGTIPYTYNWNSSPSTLDISNLNTGSYQLTVIDANGCSALSQVFNITNEAGPIIDATNSTLINESCNMSNGSISGVTISGGTGPYTNNWNASTSTLDIGNLATGSYQLIVIDANGCTDTANTFNITNILGPTINSSNVNITPESCELSNGSISAITINGNAPYTYNWSNGTNSLDNNNLTEGNYELIVTDVNGCSGNTSIIVPEIGFPTAGFNSNETTYTINEPILISNLASTDVINWSYDSGNGTTLFIQNPSFTYSLPGDYTICQTVTNSYGCEDNFCNTISIVEENILLIIPNIFTPNNDNLNDLFFIENLPDNSSLKIFDRWGDIVYKSSPYLNNWNGKTKNGTQLSDGTYYYIIEDNIETYTGHFSIVK